MGIVRIVAVLALGHVLVSQPGKLTMGGGLVAAHLFVVAASALLDNDPVRGQSASLGDLVRGMAIGTGGAFTLPGRLQAGAVNGLLILCQFLFMTVAAGLGGIELVRGGTRIAGGQHVMRRMTIGAASIVFRAFLLRMHRMGVLPGLDDDIQAVAVQPGRALGGRALPLLDVTAHAIDGFQVFLVGQGFDIAMTIETTVLAMHALVQHAAVHMQGPIGRRAMLALGHGKALLPMTAQAIAFLDVFPRNTLFPGQWLVRRLGQDHKGGQQAASGKTQVQSLHWLRASG